MTRTNNKHYRYFRPSSEDGSIFLETIIVTPLLIAIFLFSADFIIYSKSHTYISQVTRDAAIFLATTPESPSVDDEGVNQDLYTNNEYSQTCSDPDSYPSFCPHYEAQLRAYRAIVTGNYLDLDSLSIKTSYDNSNDVVMVEIEITPTISFFFTQHSITKNAQLKRVNLI